ncbi:hypothetical protein C5167_030522 [Papaver somniferum]|uniref:uncharacterized protein LOC113329279 n=1 Tax=Papaver somniferum TaxID=3469 RepID=UPI000E6F970E|nr:uncharacterized protein LOC113329279 [Papaver somniferum]RZC86444.1 hypothetical protein C5167_030522 [Papaver somniferum]
MVKRFFWIKQQTVDEHNDSAASHNNDPQITLLSGPPSCGKTSLLFQFAVNNVLEQGRDVIFICSKHRLEKKPPFLSQGLDPSSDIFQKIKMKYVEDDEGIKKYFAAFHMHWNNEGGTFPGAVIIDDFGEFFDDTNCKQRYGGNYRGRDLAVVRSLALCRDAILHANERLLLESSLVGGDKYSCKLLISDTHLGDTPRSLFIYKRWVPSIFTIKPGDGSGSYLLNNITSSTSAGIISSTGATLEALASTTVSAAGRKKTAGCAKYSIALQYLMLEDLII